MRKVTCTPNMAKGALLANETKVGKHLLPPGKIIGNDEVSWLNEAGIKEIEVIKVGVQDQLANAAINRLGEALAGRGLLLIPALNGSGNLIAHRNGLLRYPYAELETILGPQTQSDFSVKIKPCLRRVQKREICAQVTSHPLVHEYSRVRTLAKALPRMEVLPLRPITIACTYRGKKPAALETWLNALSGYGSDIAKVKVKDSRDCDLLVVFTDHPGRLATSLKNSKATAFAHNNGSSTPSWLVGARGNQAMVACDGALEELTAPLLRLLDILHAGLRIDADMVAAAHSKPDPLHFDGRD